MKPWFLCAAILASAAYGSAGQAPPEAADAAVSAAVRVADLVPGPAATKEPAQAAPTPAALRDAAWYAERYKVSLDEAVRRLLLQPKVGELEIALTRDAASSFGGLWIEHYPAFRVVVAFTHGADTPPSLSAWRDSWGVPIELRSVRWSLAELEAHQRDAERLVTEAKVPSNSDINVFENRVEIHVLEDGRTKLADAHPALPASVEIVVMSSLARLDAFNGGVHLTPQCTGAFTVSKVVGGVTLRGILTAGHCSNGLSAPGTRLRFQGEQNLTGSGDVQWHSACGTDISDDFSDGLSLRDVQGTLPRAQQSIGDGVCKYGKVTGYDCGHIDSKSFNPLPGITEPTFIRVEGDPVPAGQFSSEGDSGGPWFLLNTAYGVHSGRPGTRYGEDGANDAVYTAINYISTLGVSVLTSDPSGGSCTGCSIAGCQVSNPNCCPGWSCVEFKPGSQFGNCL